MTTIERLKNYLETISPRRTEEGETVKISAGYDTRSPVERTFSVRELREVVTAVEKAEQDGKNASIILNAALQESRELRALLLSIKSSLIGSKFL